MPALAEAIEGEIKLRADYLPGRSLDSVYLGGGTPSLLSTEQLRGILGALRERFSWESTAEVTIEANPDDISPGNLSDWQSLGINRISLGLQSFNDDELRWMNRAHNGSQGIDAVKLAQDKGFTNLSVDLIYGSRFQTLDSWKSTLATTVGLGVPHVSSYNLTIEKKTSLGAAVAKGHEPPVSDELSSVQFLLMSEVLEGCGYEHYEISNFALPGRRAVHNSNYWRQQPYLGLGPSAHSFDGISRQWNVSNNQAYIQGVKNGIPVFEREVLSLRDRFNEYVLTRLRTIWGCDAREIAAWFGGETLRHFLRLTEQKKEHFVITGERYTLRKESRLLADGIASDLFL